MNKARTLAILACAFLAFIAHAKTVTIDDLKILPPFNIENSQPTRSDLDAVFGKGREFSRGQGGEKFWGYCYAFPGKKTRYSPVRSLAFLFTSSEMQARATGVLLSSKDTSCPKIATGKSIFELNSSVLFEISGLSPERLRSVLPGSTDPSDDTDSDELIIRIYESKKLIRHGDRMHSPEVAYQLHQLREADYQIDSVTTFRTDFKNKKIHDMTIWLKTSY